MQNQNTAVVERSEEEIKAAISVAVAQIKEIERRVDHFPENDFEFRYQSVQTVFFKEKEFCLVWQRIEAYDADFGLDSSVTGDDGDALIEAILESVGLSDDYEDFAVKAIDHRFASDMTVADREIREIEIRINNYTKFDSDGTMQNFCKACEEALSEAYPDAEVSVTMTYGIYGEIFSVEAGGYTHDELEAEKEVIRGIMARVMEIGDYEVVEDTADQE